MTKTTPRSESPGSPGWAGVLELRLVPACGAAGAAPRDAGPLLSGGGQPDSGPLLSGGGQPDAGRPLVWLAPAPLSGLPEPAL